MEMNNDRVTAGVEDDGIGFDLDKFMTANTGTNFGLISMRERIDLLGGELDIDTKPGKGTKISFSVPVAR